MGRLEVNQNKSGFLLDGRPFLSGGYHMECIYQYNDRGVGVLS